MDVFDNFKAMQKQNWAHFTAFEMLTTPAAAKLVKFANVRSGQRVLDVGCGTGVVSVTAARQGARVSALDLTPELLERARENARIAEVEVEWREGDVEKLPYENGSFDTVMSQFGHMFAPRPTVAIAEMLRVLKPGGTIAFSTWPPELFTGKTFALTAKYMPPMPEGVSPPPQWGDVSIVRERLGTAVKDLFFDRATMTPSALSPQHFRVHAEQHAGPVVRLVQTLEKTAPEKLTAFRKEYDALTVEYFEGNFIRQDFLMTRATKI